MDPPHVRAARPRVGGELPATQRQERGHRSGSRCGRVRRVGRHALGRDGRAEAAAHLFVWRDARALARHLVVLLPRAFGP